MAKKKLQNDFTTPEQSKRLLELGVPADSANYAYMCYEIGDMCRVFINHPYTIYSENVKRLLGRKTLPCWSVGRLIEICLKCSTLEQRQVRFFCNRDNDEYSLIDYVVTVLESGVMTNHIDFSKLED